MASTGLQDRLTNPSNIEKPYQTKRIWYLQVYEGTNNEYYNFCSKACAFAIDNYLLYRKRCGENISFNQNTNMWEPSTGTLLRQQFDEDDILKARRPKPVETIAIRRALTAHLIRCGLREVEHPTADNTNSTNRCRKEVALSNGFRNS